MIVRTAPAAIAGPDDRRTGTNDLAVGYEIQ
jgi:hypothetical protein